MVRRFRGATLVSEETSDTCTSPSLSIMCSEECVFQKGGSTVSSKANILLQLFEERDYPSQPLTPKLSGEVSVLQLCLEQTNQEHFESLQCPKPVHAW